MYELIQPKDNEYMRNPLGPDKYWRVLTTLKSYESTADVSDGYSTLGHSKEERERDTSVSFFRVHFSNRSLTLVPKFFNVLFEENISIQIINFFHSFFMIVPNFK